MSMDGRRLPRWLASGPPLLYLLVFFAIPTLIMVLASFRVPGDFGGLAPLIEQGEDGERIVNLTLESYQRFFSDALYAELFAKSFGYALLTTALCLLIGYPLSLLIARSPKRHRDLLVLLVILPFWSNFLIRVYAWMIILGPQSVFSNALNAFLALFGFEPVRLLFTPFAVVVGLVYVHLPFMVLPLYASLEKVDPRLIEAGGDLYASPFTAFRKITLPLSMPGLVAGTLLTFIPASGDYINAQLLGNPKTRMIGNEIEDLFAAGAYPLAAALSVTLMAAIVVMVLFYVRRAGTEDLV